MTREIDYRRFNETVHLYNIHNKPIFEKKKKRKKNLMNGQLEC